MRTPSRTHTHGPKLKGCNVKSGCAGNDEASLFFNALATHLKRIKNRSAVLGHALVPPVVEMPSLCAKVIASRPGLKWKKTSLPCWIHCVGLNDKVSLSLCWSGAIPMEPGLRKKSRKSYLRGEVIRCYWKNNNKALWERLATRGTEVQAQSTSHLVTVATALSLGAQSLKSDKNGIFALPLCVQWSLACSKRHTTPPLLCQSCSRK